MFLKWIGEKLWRFAKGLVRARIFLQVAEWGGCLLTTHFMLMVVLVWILGQRVTLQGERSPFYSRENSCYEGGKRGGGGLSSAKTYIWRAVDRGLVQFCT